MKVDLSSVFQQNEKEIEVQIPFSKFNEKRRMKMKFQIPYPIS